MRERAAPPAINRTNDVVADALVLQQEVADLRGQLAAVNDHFATERSLAETIRHARNLVILENPLLCQIFDVENMAAGQNEPVAAETVLASAFATEVETNEDAAGMVNFLQKILRAGIHPDAGGDAEAAKTVGGALQHAEVDPVHGLATALLHLPDQTDMQDLRNIRYRLHVALSQAKPVFPTVAEAEAATRREINGAQWRVRTHAVMKSFGIITGGKEAWQTFLQSIIADNKVELANMVNEYLPEMLSLQERFMKGDPPAPDKLDLDMVDRVLARIWTVIDPTSEQYSPPYQNWFGILLPAMRALDPGRKPGQQYTDFQPPIIVRRPYYQPAMPSSGIYTPRNYNDFEPFSYGKTPYKEEYNESPIVEEPLFGRRNPYKSDHRQYEAPYPYNSPYEQR